MKMKINDIPESGFTLTESFDPVALNLQTPSVSFKAPLKINAAFSREKRPFYWIGIETSLRAALATCTVKTPSS